MVWKIDRYLHSLLLVIGALGIVNTQADCPPLVNTHNVFQHQEIYNDMLIIKLKRVDEALELQNVNITMKTIDGDESL